MRSPPHVSVVLKRSAWRQWVEEERDERVTGLVEAGDETVRRVGPAHREHLETIEAVRQALSELGAVVTWHDRAPGFHVEGPCDLVVTVGGDGTLLAASHGIGPGVPLLGVNSAPNHSVGFFCAAKKGSVREALAGALDGTLRRVELTRMRVELNGRTVHHRVLNEALFCHASPAATSRYILRILESPAPSAALSPEQAGGEAGQPSKQGKQGKPDKPDRQGKPDEPGKRGKGGAGEPRGPEGDAVAIVAAEEQKSSGIWVGPAAGSTAAQRSAGGRLMPLSSRRLQYVVREPYLPNGSPLRLTLGFIEEQQVLAMKSQMRQARLFLDGDRIVHEVTIGDTVTMRRSDEPLVVLGLTRVRAPRAASAPASGPAAQGSQGSQGQAGGEGAA